MAITDPASLDAPPARRPHAAVVGLVGGPYPNLSSTRRPSLAAAQEAPPDGAPLLLAQDTALVELHATTTTFPVGGPYPNLPDLDAGC